MTRRVFHKDDFAVFEGEIVRLKGQILREIAGLTLAAAPIRECVKVVRWLESWTLLTTRQFGSFLIPSFWTNRRRFHARSARVFRCRRSLEAAERSWRSAGGVSCGGGFRDVPP